MKLAEALNLRSSLIKQIAELKRRLEDCVRIQEGEIHVSGQMISVLSGLLTLLNSGRNIMKNLQNSVKSILRSRCWVGCMTL